MFDMDRFIAECRAAAIGSNPERAIGEMVARAVSDPGAVMAALGAPERAGITKLYNGPEITILNVVWGPRMTIHPHNHNMWATIGVYTGREDNVYWRRRPGLQGECLEAAGAQSIGAREAAKLGRDIIHSVTNPTGKCTGALHLYLGDFFTADRSEWEPETLTERPYDMANVRGVIEENNRLYSA